MTKSVLALLDGTITRELSCGAEQQAVFLMYTSDPHLQLTDQDAIHDCRHESLRFLAWLTEGWPDSPGAQVAQSMLHRWLMSTFNYLSPPLFTMYGQACTTGPTNFDPTIRARLEAMASASL
jgi:hypothetical protein